MFLNGRCSKWNIQNLPSVPIRAFLSTVYVVGFTVDTGCKPCPTGTTGGTITSPDYPNDYASMGTFACVYQLTASTGYTVKMTLASESNVPSGILNYPVKPFPGLVVSKKNTSN